MFFKKDFKIKVLALSLAISLKLFIHGSSDIVPITIPLALEIKNLPPTMMVVSQQNWEKGVSLDLKGPKILADQVRNYPNKVVVDYPEDDPLELRVELMPEQFWVPPGVEILNINPTFVDISFDRIVVKELPVEPQFDGKFKKGKFKVTATPARILVRGPKKELDKLNKIPSEIIYIDDLTESKTFNVYLLNQSRNITIQNNQVSVQVQLENE